MKAEQKKQDGKRSIEEELKNQFTVKSFANIIIVFCATILFTLTGIWQLVVLAGFIGGFFTSRFQRAFLIGFIGVFLGWMALFIYYTMTTELLLFFTFWFEETMGFPLGVVYLWMTFSSLLGGVVGALGALNGLFVSRIILKYVSSKYLLS